MKNQKRNVIMRVVCSVFIFCIIINVSACSNLDTEQVKDKFNEKQEEISKNIQKEAKEAVITQIEDFFQDTDFMEAFGISEEDKLKMKEQLETLVNDYEFDISNLKDIQEQLDTLFDPDTIAEQENQDYEKINAVLEKMKKQILNSLK